MGTNITGIGNANAIGFKSRVTGGMYFPPELKDALVGVWSAYGKSNDSTDRNIIKNKIKDRGGDFELINFNYEGTSGYNGYPVVFGKDKTYQYVNHSPNYNQTTINVTHFNTRQALLYSYIQRNGELTSYNRDYPSYKIKVSGLEEGFGLMYQYNSKADATSVNALRIETNGIYTIPKSFASDGSLTDANIWVGFVFTGTEQEQCNVTIEVLPEYKGAVVTDGVDDMIVSQNTVSEILGGSNELTVVSMIHQITAGSNVEGKGFTNYIRTSDNNWISNRISNIDKTGIYGYSLKQSVLTVINNILGDKNDYTTENAGDFYESLRANFSVEGFKHITLGTVHTTSVAWYWTFIAKRVLTTDEINQVIAYYNLDKYVKPDIYYNVKKQGLTNDTPDEDWYLKDFSGNGRDMTLYNYARTPESGINEEGGLQSDGVDDYGQFVGDLGLKDYTVIIDRAYPIVSERQYTATSDATGENSNTPFLLEHIDAVKDEYAYSYLAATAISINKEREICYQSTYQYKDTVIKKGSSTSLGTGLTIAKYGVNPTYSALVLYSFMLFHYSMSKFLIERQLKKHKLGTLYPGMVDFRPIISGRTDLIKGIKWYSDSWSKRIYVGDYIPKGVDVTANILLNDNTSELVKATYGNNYTEVRKQANWSETNNEWDLIIHNIGKSPQKIGITIDEYIRFEDIVQPYPVKFRFTDVDSGQVYDWGSKIKVGSTIKILSNVDIGNYLSDIYTITGYKYNGNIYSYNELNKLTFEVTNSPLEFASRKTYKLGGYEPKVILYPERLKLSNDTYKRLGYIPDLTGNGNHGKINNSAYGGMSGVNGYPYDYKSGFMAYSNSKLIDSETFNIIAISASVNIIKSSPTYKGKIKVTGLSGYLKLRIYPKNDSTNAVEIFEDGIYDINIDNETDNIYFHAVKTNVGSNDVNIIIQQVGEYEGAFCLDGVDDYISIPTLSKGGKQVLMKVNWQKQDTMLYNQNPGQDNFAIFTNDYNNNNLVVAYASRNNGNTYIDGVVNNNILATQLKGITHNIVATNNNIDATITPIIGSNKNHDNFFAQMALYSFMLFDEISTDEEIKELNNIVGIEGDYVQKPSYYWDAYGKSNLDVDKGYIKDQVSLQLNNDTTNNNSLENFNFGYEGMSGYNGYPVIFGANKTWKNKAPEGPNSYICTINANKYNITQILLSNAWAYSYIKENGELTKYNKDVGSFKIKVTGLKSEIPLRYSYLSSTDATVTSNITIKSDGTYELPKSFANDGSLIDNYGWIGFSFTRVSVDIPEIITDVNITIEILPEYKNGLVYDGVDDYSENASIPLLSDYTYIFKRTLLNKKYNSASIFKGSNQQSGGGAFICDYNSVEPDLLTQGYSFGAGLYVDSLNADSIVYGTRGSVNGTKITAGNNTDTEGLTVGKWRAYKEMVFYKLFLYPRTVNMLSINMVKNMMEEDGIIDLTSKLFTDKYTGDFYEMDFNNDFLIGN